MTAVSQTYLYDSVNRLTLATENPASGASCPDASSHWCELFSYDSYGNRSMTQSTNTGIVAPINFSPSTNQIIDSGWGCDHSGNLNRDFQASLTYKFDAENRQVSATINSVTTSYAYDGNGRRIQNTTPQGTTNYVYDAAGQLAAEYSTAPPTDSGTSYLVADHLGSTRLVMEASGSTKCYDYLPFGGEIAASVGNHPACYSNITYPTTPDSLSEKFTAKERDAETGLDFFGARYFSAAQGRFTSPDPIFFKAEMLTDPQRFNLYSYVRNNPLRYVDPKGEEIELTGTTDEERKKELAALQAAVDKKGHQLKIVHDEKSGKYLVEINGDVEAFSKINDVAAGLANAIQNPENAKFAFAASAERLALDKNGQSLTLRDAQANGATGRDSNGQLWIYVLRPSECCGSSSGADFGRTTLGGLLDFLGITSVSNDLGIVSAHELGHADYLMRTGRSGNLQDANKAALDLENAARKARNPNAPVRTRHP